MNPNEPHNTVQSSHSNPKKRLKLMQTNTVLGTFLSIPLWTTT